MVFRHHGDDALGRRQASGAIEGRPQQGAAAAQRAVLLRYRAARGVASERFEAPAIAGGEDHDPR
jgi:hypothetical protein